MLHEYIHNLKSNVINKTFKFIDIPINPFYVVDAHSHKCTHTHTPTSARTHIIVTVFKIYYWHNVKNTLKLNVIIKYTAKFELTLILKVLFFTVSVHEVIREAEA